MIGQLRGKIINRKAPVLILDVQGVGYEVNAPMTTFYEVENNDSEIILHTHLVVREDSHSIYGFHDTQTRDLFRLLIKANGVGPKLALTILSSLSLHEFLQCIEQKAATQLQKVPGIGKKTSERLIMEMQDAIKKLDIAAGSIKPATSSATLATDEAISALISLGYKPNDAASAIKSASTEDNLSSEALIRLALKQLAGGISA